MDEIRISKSAIVKDQYKNPLYFFYSARNAFQTLLMELNRKGESILLLPGYIGYSPNEGSGIYDPVKAIGIKHLFYKVDSSLSADLADLEKKLTFVNRRKIVLIVHYFGFPDVHIDEMVSICKKNEAIIIEDSAHAMFTDIVDRRCGAFGDYTLYSIHKMLPFENGGILKINSSADINIGPEFEFGHYNIWDYDFAAIAEQRKRNAQKWRILLAGVDGIHPLRELSDVVTPQTYPVIVEKYDRNKLYFQLNDAGFGAVSLYHTMIEPLQKDGFEEAVWLSHHIINLPVHQDINERHIEEMSEVLLEILGKSG